MIWGCTIPKSKQKNRITERCTQILIEQLTMTLFTMLPTNSFKSFNSLALIIAFDKYVCQFIQWMTLSYIIHNFILFEIFLFILFF